MSGPDDVMGDAWLCPHCGEWTTMAAAFCRVCKDARRDDAVVERDCDHIWMHQEAGEDASAYLNAPERTATWTEPVFVCTLCDLVQPEPWVENRLTPPRKDATNG